MTRGQYVSVLTGMTTIFLAIKEPETWTAGLGMSLVFVLAVLIPKLIITD